MQTVNDLFDRVQYAFINTVNLLVDRSPTLLLAGLVMLLGWGVAKLLRWVVERMSAVGRLDTFAQRIGLSKALVRVGFPTVGSMLGVLVYWAIILGAIMLAAEVLGMDPVIDGISRIFAYLPTLVAALSVFLVGLWMADKARFVMGTMTELMGLSSGKTLGRIIFGIILLFLSITALNVAGVDTSLITSNILIVVGSLFISFSIAYGFAAKDILTNILSSYYGKERFKAGMHVRIGQDEGVIDRIDSISLTLRTNDREILIPTSTLITQRIEIIDAVKDPLA
jgi:uncharacterized protein YacL